MQTEIARLAALHDRAQHAGHRQLLWITGEQALAGEWMWQSLVALADHRQAQGRATRVFWVGLPTGADEPRPGLEVTFIAAQQARRWLGQGCDLLVFDAWQGLHPDALGAISGTLKGGGLCFLLSPLGADWAYFADPDYQRMQALPDVREGRVHYFLARASTLLGNWLAAGHRGLSQCTLRLLPQGEVSCVLTIPHEGQVCALANTDPWRGADLTGQAVAVEALVRVVKGHRRRPLMLTADRGRGKTAALGLAAARLLLEQPRELIITAPVQESLGEAFRFFAGACAPLHNEPGELVLANGSRFRFVPVDVLIRDTPPADALWVDEAAGIPVSLLESLLLRYPRIAFASTLHGYEGAGRGFSLRFAALLDSHTPQWRRLHLHQPIRWASGDPLEHMVFRLLALDAEPMSDTQAQALAPLPVQQWVVQELRAPDLVAHEDLLREVFGLLVLAHYQTSADDLRMLLDAPGVRLWGLCCGPALGAVALTIAEGELPETLHEAITAGRRRLRGQLIPQSMAHFCGLPAILGMRGWRVVRLAVHPKLQQRGLGQALMRFVAIQAQQESQDWIGASFGATQALTDFWRRLGYQPVRLGLQRDAASGEQAITLLRGLSLPGQALCAQAQDLFAASLDYHLDGVFRALPVGLVWSLLQACTGCGVWRSVCLSAHSAEAVRRFAQGERLFESVAPALRHWLMQRIAQRHEPRYAEPQTRHALELLILALVQKQDWLALARFSQVTGRRDTELALRRAVAQLLAL